MMEDHTHQPFGSRPIRVQMRVDGRMVERLLTPRQMGMSETAIAEMESLGDEAKTKRKANAA